MKRYIRSAIAPMDDASLDTRFEIAQDFATNRNLLQSLATRDPDPDVREWAQMTLRNIDKALKLIHRPCSIEHLRAFATAYDPHWRWAAAQHPDTPVDVLQKLTEDEDSRVRKAAQEHLRELGS